MSSTLHSSPSEALHLQSAILLDKGRRQKRVTTAAEIPQMESETCSAEQIVSARHTTTYYHRLQPNRSGGAAIFHPPAGRIDPSSGGPMACAVGAGGVA